jgi:hypothetical protein
MPAGREGDAEASPVTGEITGCVFDIATP